MPSPSSRFSGKRWFVYTVVVLAIGLGTWYFAFRGAPARTRPVQPAWAGKGGQPLIPVKTVVAEARDLPVHLKAIGTVTPVNTVTVKPRVGGQLLRVGFEEGQRVEAGQLLAEIDPAPLRIRLSQVEGQLKQNTVQVGTARADLERIRTLHAQKLVTDQELEAQRALLGEREGALAAVQAQVDDARLQLAYTRIEAPIAGRAGLRQLDAGNLITAGGTTGLVVITQTRPISVAFTIPEIELQGVLDPYRAGEKLVVEAWDRRETGVLATGALKTLDNQIDTATGTLKLKAEFANEDDRLFPNQFVNVRMRVRTIKGAVVIPSAAVQFGSRGTYVYVIDETKKAVIRDIVLGAVDGTYQAVTKGLKAGDAVVLEGLDRLREGRGVIIVNDSNATAKLP